MAIKKLVYSELEVVVFLTGREARLGNVTWEFGNVTLANGKMYRHEMLLTGYSITTE
ncbi:MAG: hypothetical protein R2830_24345 [Saprospiraceae bacterium]